MQKSTLLFIGLFALPVFFGLKARAQGVAINTDGTTPATMLHVKGGDANSNIFEILRIERIDNNSAGANGIGASQTYYVESATAGTSVLGGSIDVTLDDATAGTQAGSMLFNVAVGGVNKEVMRVDGTAGNVGIGSTAPGAGLDVVSATATGIGAKVDVNALTTGSGFQVNSLNAASTGNAFIVSSNSTGAEVAGISRFNFTGAHTNVGFLLDDVTTTGTAMRINANSLTSGTGLSVASSSVGLTTSLANITLSGNNVANTGSVLSLNSSGVASIAKALDVSVNSTGNLANGGVLFAFNGNHSGKGFQINDVTVNGTAMEINANSLAAGMALEVLSSTTTLNGGSIVDVNLTGNNAGNTNISSVLSLQSGGALNLAKALSVTVGSTGNLASGGVFFSFSGAHTGQGFRINDVTTAGTAMQMNVNSLVGGKGLQISSTATGLTGNLAEINLTGDNAGNTNTSNLLYINSSGALSLSHAIRAVVASTGNLASGGIIYEFTGNHTGNGFQIDDVTTTGTAMKMNTNSLTTGDALNIASTSTGLTSGSLIDMSSASTGLTGSLQSITLSGNNAANTGNLLKLESQGAASIAKALNVVVASTGNFSTTGAVSYNFNGNHSGIGFALADVSTTGTAMAIGVDNLTTGNGLVINSTSTGITDGSLLAVNHTGATAAMATNGIVHIHSDANYTSAANRGLLAVVANSTTAGTLQLIRANALTTGSALHVASTTTGLTNNLQEIVLSGNNAGNTGNLLLLNSSGAASVAKALDVEVASAGNLTAGGVLFNFSGAHTGTGFQIDESTATGIAIKLNANSLTTGVGLGVNANAVTTGDALNIASTSTGLTSGSLIDMSSASTGLTGSLQVITLSGNNANNVNGASLLGLKSTGALSVAKAIDVSMSSTGNLTSGGVLFSFSGAHTGTGFQIDNATATGTAMKLTASALTSGTGLSVISTNAASTGTAFAVVSNSTGAETNGISLFNFTGAHTNSGFQITDVTQTGTVMSLAASALTTGVGLAVSSTNAAATGKAFVVTSNSTGAVGNGIAHFDFSGAHTNNGLQIDDVTVSGTAMQLNSNSTTTGKALNISASALTTGEALTITAGGATALTTGNALLVTGPTGAAALSNASGGVVKFVAAGDYTTANGASLLNVEADATTAGTIQNISGAALTTGKALDVTVDALTTGFGMRISSASAGITNGSLLRLTSTGALGTANSTVLSVLSTGVNTDGYVASVLGNNTTSGGLMNVSSSSTGFTAANVGGMVNISLTGNAVANTGSLLNINSSGALSLSKALNVSVASTGNLASGGVLYNFSGAHTGNAIQIDDVTLTGTVMALNANSVTTGKGLDISVDALTRGDALLISSTGTGLTDGSLLKVSSATTGAVATDGVVSINASGNYTSTANIGLLTVLANSTAAGTIQRISGNALTTGDALHIASTGAGLTSGSLLYLTSATTGAVSDGIVSLNASADYTSTNDRGLLSVVANSLTAGTIQTIKGNALTSGAGLNIASSSAGLTGNMQEIVLTGNNVANTGNLLYLSSSGANSIARGLSVDLNSTGNLGTGGVLFDFAAHTGSGFGIIDATATGDASKISVNSLTSGTGFTLESSGTGMTGNMQIIRLTGNNAGNTGNLLTLDVQGALSLAKALNITVASTGNLANGGVFFGFSAAHTGTGFKILDATATGKGVELGVDGLTSGIGLQVASASPSLSGSLLDISLTGNDVNNTGNLLNLSSTGANSIAKAVSVTVASTGNLAAGGVMFNFTGNHTGFGLALADVTTAGTAVRFDVDNLTTGKALSIGTGALTSGNALYISALSGGALTGDVAYIAGGGANNGTSTGNVLNLVSNANATLVKALKATVNSAANLTTGGVLFDFTGAHTGQGFQIDDVTVSGDAMEINANSLTTGTALNISSTGTGLTAGSLLRLTSATTGQLVTNGIFSINATGNYTSFSDIGAAFSIQANATTAGTVASINAGGLTTGKVFNVSAASITSGRGLEISGGGVGFTGEVASFTTGAGNGTSTGTVVKVWTPSDADAVSLPFMVTNGGVGATVRINDDGTDNDASPFLIDNTGSVGIGNAAPAVKLHVTGTIRGTVVQATTAGAGAFEYNTTTDMNVPDYVFDKYVDNCSDENPEYSMMSINELEHFVKTERHLPRVPSRSEIEKDGIINVQALSMVMLEKIEELSLYLIEQQAEIENLKSDNKNLRSEIEKLQTPVSGVNNVVLK